MAEVTPEEIDRLLDNVPQRNELSPEVLSVLAWQAENNKDLFENAYPDRTFLELRERVRAEIMNMILSRELKPGEPQEEDQVVDSLTRSLEEDVFGEPVQEALAILVRDGFLQNIHPQEPKIGVVNVSADETLEVLSLSGELEAVVVEKLLTADEPRKLARIQAAQNRFARAEDLQNRMLADTAFHRGLALSAGLDDAAYAIERWRQKLHLYSLTLERQVEIDTLGREHEELIGAIEEATTAEQTARVLQLLDQHLEHTAESLKLV